MAPSRAAVRLCPPYRKVPAVNSARPSRVPAEVIDVNCIGHVAAAARRMPADNSAWLPRALYRWLTGSPQGARTSGASEPSARSSSAAAAAAAVPAPQRRPAPAQQAAGAKPAPEYSTRNFVVGSQSFEVSSRYKIKTIVGKGAYGLVCAAEDLAQGSRPEAAATAEGASPSPPMVAVKKVLDPFNDHTDCKRLLREVRLLRCLRHPNVLHLTDLLPPPHLSPALGTWKDVYLVTRLLDTNLHRVIYSGHALTDAHVQYILWQVKRARASLPNSTQPHDTTAHPRSRPAGLDRHPRRLVHSVVPGD